MFLAWSNFDAIWKDIFEVEQNNTNLRQSKQEKEEIWAKFASLIFYFQYMIKKQPTSSFFLSIEQ